MCGKYARRGKLAAVNWLSAVVAGYFGIFTGSRFFLAKGGRDDLYDGISKLDLESPSSLKFDELKFAESVASGLEVTIRHHEYLIARPGPHTRCQKRDHLLTTWGGATTRRVLNPFTSNTGRRLFNEKFSFTSSLFDMTRERVFSTRVKGEV